MKKTLALILPILGLLIPNLGSAAPVAQFSAQGVTVTLTDEDCRLKDTVVNLPKRATWTENGKDIEGCWGTIQQISMISFYFADKTATALPMQIFSRVTGA